jgi:hypothetical protein
MANAQADPAGRSGEHQDQGAHVPGRFTLGDFVLDPGCTDGVGIQALEPGVIVAVKTRHSCYRFVVLNAPERRAMVVGGVFPQTTPVRVEGATDGGSSVKLGWIGVGLRLEVSIGVRRITTSRVQSVTIEPGPLSDLDE